MDMENKNETNAPEKPHKRRIRYSGTHPKTYKEKYKEHQPGKVCGHDRARYRKGRNTRRYAHLDLR